MLVSLFFPLFEVFIGRFFLSGGEKFYYTVIAKEFNKFPDYSILNKCQIVNTTNLIRTKSLRDR